MHPAFRWAAAAVLFLAMPATAAPIAGGYVPPMLSSTVMVNAGCTGWYIGGDLIVTASHCLTTDGKRPTVKFSNGVEFTAGVVYLANVAEGGDDFMVLRLRNDPRGWLPPMSIECNPDLPIGTDVYMTGYPGGAASGIGQFTATGKVARANGRLQDWPHVLGVDMTAFGGFSGSAVRRTSDNKVVGILVGGMTKSPGIAFMVPTTKLCHVLEIA